MERYVLHLDPSDIALCQSLATAEGKEEKQFAREVFAAALGRKLIV